MQPLGSRRRTTATSNARIARPRLIHFPYSSKCERLDKEGTGVPQGEHFVRHQHALPRHRSLFDHACSARSEGKQPRHSPSNTRLASSIDPSLTRISCRIAAAGKSVTIAGILRRNCQKDRPLLPDRYDCHVAAEYFYSNTFAFSLARRCRGTHSIFTSSA